MLATENEKDEKDDGVEDDDEDEEIRRIRTMKKMIKRTAETATQKPMKENKFQKKPPTEIQMTTKHKKIYTQRSSSNTKDVKLILVTCSSQ